MRDRPLSGADAQRIGRSIGTILAEQHAKIAKIDVAGWLPQQVAWPESRHWMRERLFQVVNDHALIGMMEQVIERYEAVRVGAKDYALVHGDVGLHNLALDPETDTVNGIFDYDSAAWTDPHYDFRYLLFDVDREDMLDAALEVYEAATGRQISRDRVLLYNQTRIRSATMKQIPRIASAGNHLANIEAARRDEEDSRYLIRAPFREQAQNATLNS